MQLDRKTIKIIVKNIKEKLDNVFDPDMLDFCGEWHVDALMLIESELGMSVEDFDVLDDLRGDIDYIYSIKPCDINLTSRQVVALIRTGIIKKDESFTYK
jgi:hypothetical protein